MAVNIAKFKNLSTSTQKTSKKTVDIDKFKALSASNKTEEKKAKFYTPPETFETQQDYADWRSTIESTPQKLESNLKQIDKDISYWKERQKAYETVANTEKDPTVVAEFRKLYDDATTKLTALEQSKAITEEERQWSEYFTYSPESLSQNSDWDELSKYVSTANGREAVKNATIGYGETGYNDIMYDYINRNEDAIAKQNVIDTALNRSLLGIDDSFLKQMTDDEIATFNYLYALDEKAGDKEHKKAYEFINYIKNDLTYLQRKQQAEQWSQYAKESPVAASVFSALMAPAKLISTAGQFADYGATGEVDPNAGYNKFSQIPSDIRSEVGKSIESKWGKVGSFLYETGMSMADFLFNTAVSGGNSTVAQTIMGTGAAADTTLDALNRGVDSKSALWLGAVAGAAEAFTERVSLEALLGKTQWSKTAVGYLLSNVLSEGTEEMASELINTIADIIISKDKSYWQAAINAYKAEGLSEEEAFRKALVEKAKEIGLAGLGGALSGGAIGSVGAITGAYNSFAAEPEIDITQPNVPSIAEPMQDPVQAAVVEALDKAAGNQTVATQPTQTTTAPAYTTVLPRAGETLPTVKEVLEKSNTTVDPNKARTFSKAESGIDYSDVSTDEYIKSNAVDGKTLSALDEAAKALGVKLRFADTVAGGNANAQIANGIIDIEKGNSNPLRFLFGHEITHRMQELAPTEYAELRETVLSNTSDVDAKIKSIQNNYAIHGGSISSEAAMDEIVADKIGEFLENDGELERFIKANQNNRTLLEKLRDIFRDLWNKLKNTQHGKQFKAVEKRLSETLNAAVTQAQTNAEAQKNTTQESGGEAKFSTKSDVLALDSVDWMDNNSSIKSQLQKHADVINKMKPVAVVEFTPKSAPKLNSLIMDEIAKLGGKSMKRGNVTFEFEKKGVGSILAHSKTAELQAAALASPYVAKYGKLIAGQKNHENTGLTTLTYAAPVIINEHPVNVGVVIQFETNGKPRAVNVGLQSGENFKLDIKKAPKGLDSRVSRYGQGTSLPTMDASGNTIPQTPPAVKMENDIEKRAAEGESITANVEEKELSLKGSRELVKEIDRIRSEGTKQGRSEADIKADIEIAVNEAYENMKSAVNKERQKRATAVSEIKSHYKAKEKNASEKRKAAELRVKITRHVKKLSSTLLRPSDKHHIPDALQKPLAALLKAINLESYDIEFGKDAKYHRVEPGNSRYVEPPTKRTLAFRKLKEAYTKIAGESEMVIDPDLLGGDGAAGLFDEVIAMGNKRIAIMSPAELETIWKTVRAIEASIRSTNKMFAAERFATVADAADALRQENKNKTQKTELDGPGGVLGKMQKLVSVDMLTPEAFFHRLGKAGDALFRMMRNAQDEHIRIMKAISDFTHETLGKVDVNALEKEMHTVSLGGEEVSLSTAQLMELYVLMRREQARAHILVGGILPDAVSKGGLKKITKAEPIRGIALDSIVKATSLLSAEQIKIADALQKYASTDLSEYGNKASMQVYNYKKFTEENYWPIRSNRQETKSTVEGDTASTSVANKGFTKATKPNANTSVKIGSIFDTFSTHASEMATYAAWLATSEDINRIRNFTFRDGEGNRVGTVKGLFDRVHGSQGSAYVQKLLSDIANGVKGTHAETEYMSGIVGNYKAASVGANLRVIIQQPTAILRALDMIEPQYLAASVRKGGWEKALKYAPIAQWKDWGYFDINTGRQMKDVLFESDSKLGKVKQASMWAAGKMDSLSWGMLWNAVEAETKAKHKDLKPGTEEFYKAVAERFTEVVDRTQVVDGILQRSQIMRSSSGLTKMATSFMGEPTKQFNMFLSSIYDVRNSTNAETRKAAKKHLARTTTALLVSSVVNAAAQSIIDALRDDDKEKDYWEKWLAAFTGFTGEEDSFGEYFAAFWNGNVGSIINPAQYIPYAKDVISLLQGYDVARMDMESVAKTITAAQNFIKAFRGGKQTVHGAMLNLLLEASRMLGIPLSNLKRDIWSIAKLGADSTNNYLLQYNMEKFWSNVEYSGNRKVFMDILYKAYEAGASEWQTIYDDLLDSGVSEETIKNAVESRMKKAQGVKSVKDLDERFEAD